MLGRFGNYLYLCPKILHLYIIPEKEMNMKQLMKVSTTATAKVIR